MDWTTIADGGAVWKWEKIGSVNMTNGVVNKITLIADNSYTRIDCMLLTNNLTYTPLEKGEISSVDLCRDLIANIKEHDGKVSAFLKIDENAVLEQAKASDKRRFVRFCPHLFTKSTEIFSFSVLL